MSVSTFFAHQLHVFYLFAVAKLGEQLHQAQQQIKSASNSMEGKVDK